MSDAAALHAGAEPQESPLTPESWGKLGMWLFLAGDAMSFGCLIVGYGILRHASKSWPVPAAVLGINLTAFMTFVLIVSSVTMVLSLSGIQHGDRARFKKFMGLTILGGLFFLGCQAYEWTHLIRDILPKHNLAFSKDLFATTFFVLTGFHGMHVTGGVIYNICVLTAVTRGRYQAKHVEIAGLYWHFVDLVWILIFTFVYLL
ncbi:MAG: cytochrome c oxidase subunit 3 [Deltaproteobacteria bacterium]|nr:cytochrome c oxidase subunit 3 [Deltaproteobacteria bacterium]MBI2230953.1 cytochrome c oxidase subunit 3 [Deltaproteobacteria bacterium]MBI2367302.1 cytochrome c oxidase subunit 3 [Deltaproteobacteria bacterium]MBI2532515.1 cytochrome c oxidase subunit 3 [Deltaproteobacteria bacterium]MBI3063379.1 cytochrome c oxidase subunit 3 [Deltaproteobacteria bacterium]